MVTGQRPRTRAAADSGLGPVLAVARPLARGGPLVAEPAGAESAHGPRGAGRFEVAFPSEDPTKNFHAASQAIADVRALLAYIDSCHERSVLYGISLGAYVAGAVAAL